MARDVFEPGIVPGRLAPQNYDDGFSDLHPPLDEHEALVAADRCYFCHDAPCMNSGMSMSVGQAVMQGASWQK